MRHMVPVLGWFCTAAAFPFRPVASSKPPGHLATVRWIHIPFVHLRVYWVVFLEPVAASPIEVALLWAVVSVCMLRCLAFPASCGPIIRPTYSLAFPSPPLA